MAHGIVETFDPGETLVGVRLTLDPDDDESLELLRLTTGWADTRLGRAVRSLLPEIRGVQGSSEGWEAWQGESAEDGVSNGG